jgi:hypothetical protein
MCSKLLRNSGEALGQPVAESSYELVTSRRLISSASCLTSAFGHVRSMALDSDQVYCRKLPSEVGGGS